VLLLLPNRPKQSFANMSYPSMQKIVMKNHFKNGKNISTGGEVIIENKSGLDRLLDLAYFFLGHGV